MELSKKRRLAMEKYLKIDVSPQALLTEKERERRIHINQKVGTFLYHIEQNDTYRFNILLEYCRECQAYNNNQEVKEPFAIWNYSDFIEYSNLYNVNETDIQVFNELEVELEKSFTKLD